MDKEKFREALLKEAKAGNFLKAVSEALFSLREDRDDLAREIASLHNEGLVDLVAEFFVLKKDVPEGPDFFLTRHIFEQALPYLDAPIDAVMRCVVHLCREAGQDLMAGSILSGYIDFCVKDVERPREALKLIESDFNMLGEMLAATVAAGSQFDNLYYLAELLRLTNHPDIEARRHAVFSLARIQWQKGSNVPDSAVVALGRIVEEEADDRLLATAIKSAFALLPQDKTHEERLIGQIREALKKGGKHSLHAASELIMLNTQELPATLLQLLLEYLKQVDSKSIGTLDNVDYGIARLLDLENAELGLDFLENLLLAHDELVSVNVFDSSAAKICQNPKLLNKVTTRWFMRGDRALCEAIYEITSTHFRNSPRIEVDASELRTRDYVHILFIARKAIGYFFMQPVTAASIVISLMHYVSDDETLDALGELLFDPLLMNYPGSTRHYVKEQENQESGKVKQAIDSALASIERYLEVLRSVPVLPALHVSQSQRESYRRHTSEAMAKSMKAAEKKSFFSNLFATSTLLYGNKSINYTHTGTGEPHRMETPLSSHSVSMEFPRMDDVDPYGLNYMLRVFQLERFQA
ncbi:MAG TPA: hypothetical protein PLB04_13060 [Nitrospira sp.]|nr:hypothetical protein [Nitrospira sp.]